jgi:hypothetical protein
MKQQTPMQTPNVLYEIGKERQRQIDEEGHTPRDDDELDDGELAEAASAYCLASVDWQEGSDQTPDQYQPDPWAFADSDWKPENPRRDLVRAGALIVAEIERLDRLAAKPKQLEEED